MGQHSKVILTNGIKEYEDGKTALKKWQRNMLDVVLETIEEVDELDVETADGLC